MTEPARKTILLIYLQKSTFVKADLDILNQKYDVIEFPFFGKFTNNFLIPFFWIKQFFRFLFQVRRIDVFYCWFIDYHALVPAIFSRIIKKPLICVLGGVDTLKIPEIKHGIFYSVWRAPIGRFVYRSTALLLPVSKSMIDSENSYTYYPKKARFGFLNEIKITETQRIQPITTCYDQDFWVDENPERKNIISTVAFINSNKRIWIKGIDILLQVAELLPNCEFVIAGLKADYIPDFRNRYQVSENVRLEPPMSPEQLKELFNETKVYLQLSRLEGFPNVLCEAILCGCIPVGSKVFGIPEIINNPRLQVETHSPQEIKSVIESAIDIFDSENANEYKEFVQGNFGTEKREKQLFNEIDNLLTTDHKK